MLRLLSFPLFGISFILSMTIAGAAFADFDTNESLLFPAGFGTADTLKPSEWILTPPPWGWIGHALTPSLTMGLDYQTTLFGFPAAFARLQFKNGDTHWAIETYGVYFPKNIEDKRDPAYLIDHKGGQEWLRLGLTERLSPTLRYHLYLGANYADYTRYAPGSNTHFKEKIYENHLTPIYGVGLEWKLSSWSYFNINASSGNSFYYFDQIANKSMMAYSFLLAPFSTKAWGIFSRARIELTAIYVHIPDASYTLNIPIPISPIIYWQFGGIQEP